MAITEDGSQPAPVHATGTSGTTGSFTPPAGSLLVALAAVDGPSTAATTVSMSDSLSGSWTLLKRQNFHATPGTGIGGSAEVWVRDIGSSASMTVTASWAGGSNAGNLTVRVLIGALPVAGQTGASGASTSANPCAPTAVLTPTVIGSRIYGAALDFATNATLNANGSTSSIDQFNDSTNGDTWATFKGAADTTTLSSTTYGYTNANDAFNVAAAEILPAAGTSPAPYTPSGPGRIAPSGVWQPFPFAADAVTLLALSDIGTGDDSAFTVTASVPLTDTGTGDDQLAVVVDLGPGLPPPVGPGRNAPGSVWSPLPGAVDLFSDQLTDVGSGDDSALSVSASIPLTDVGAADDPPSITATVPLDDAGTGTDSLTVAIDLGPGLPPAAGPGRLSPSGVWTTLPGSLDVASAIDTGSADDSTVTVAATVPIADSGTADDSSIAATATVPLADSGTGADSITVSGNDPGPVVPQPIGPGRAAPGSAWQPFPFGLDPGSATISVADSGTGTDAVAVTASIPAADTGSGSDAADVAAAVPVGDTATAVDTLSILVTAAIADAGAALESLGITVAAPIADVGSAADAVGASASIPAADSGVASDAIGLTAVLSVTDGGTGVDAATIAGPAGPPVRGIPATASQTTSIAASSQTADIGLASRSEVTLR